MGDKVMAFVDEIKKDPELEKTVYHGMREGGGEILSGSTSIDVIRDLKDPDVDSQVAVFFDNVQIEICSMLSIAERNRDNEDVKFYKELLKEFERICKQVGIILED